RGRFIKTAAVVIKKDVSVWSLPAVVQPEIKLRMIVDLRFKPRMNRIKRRAIARLRGNLCAELHEPLSRTCRPACGRNQRGAGFTLENNGKRAGRRHLVEKGNP